MGQNAYCTWDDKAMAAIEQKYARKRRQIEDRFTSRHNALIAKIEALRVEERKAVDDLSKQRRDECDSITVALPAAQRASA